MYASVKLISRDPNLTVVTKSRLPNYLINLWKCAFSKNKSPFTDADPDENRASSARARIEFPQIHVARSAITVYIINMNIYQHAYCAQQINCIRSLRYLVSGSILIYKNCFPRRPAFPVWRFSFFFASSCSSHRRIFPRIDPHGLGAIPAAATINRALVNQRLTTSRYRF